MNPTLLIASEQEKQSRVKGVAVKLEDVVKNLPYGSIAGGFVWGSLAVLDVSSAVVYATAGLGAAGFIWAICCLALGGLSVYLAVNSIAQNRFIPLLG